MVLSYLRLTLFALGLLVGVQVPGFLADYEQQIGARRAEADIALQGYRDTAQQFFDGDLERLIAHYRASADPVFQRDASSLRVLVARQALLESEWWAMQGPWYRRAWHVLFRADDELLEHTWAAYRFQVLLAPFAIAWGIGCALVFALLAEMAWRLVTWPLQPRRRPAPPSRRH